MASTIPTAAAWRSRPHFQPPKAVSGPDPARPARLRFPEHHLHSPACQSINATRTRRDAGTRYCNGSRAQGGARHPDPAAVQTDKGRASLAHPIDPPRLHPVAEHHQAARHRQMPLHTGGSHDLERASGFRRISSSRRSASWTTCGVLTRRAARKLHAGLGDAEIGGRRLDSLDRPVLLGADSVPLVSMVSDPRADAALAVPGGFESRGLCRLVAQLKLHEQRIVGAWGAAERTWAEAAVVVGLRPEDGESVRRKCKRLAGRSATATVHPRLAAAVLLVRRQAKGHPLVALVRWVLGRWVGWSPPAAVPLEVHCGLLQGRKPTGRCRPQPSRGPAKYRGWQRKGRPGVRQGAVMPRLPRPAHDSRPADADRRRARRHCLLSVV